MTTERETEALAEVRRTIDTSATGWQLPRDVVRALHACVDRLEHALANHDARIVAEAEARGAERVRARVEALADEWADFEHDAVACLKFDCGDCTMLNAIHDLRAALADREGEA